MNHAIGRLLYEITSYSRLPLHIWAVAMMYFHAFGEYADDQEQITEPRDKRLYKTMVGITCLTLAAKSNESYLVSQGLATSPTQCLLNLLDSTTRVMLSYTTNSVSREKIVDTKRRLKEFIPTVELAILRVMGNSLVVETGFMETGLDETSTAVLMEIYSSPLCLNIHRNDISYFVKRHNNQCGPRKAIGNIFQ
jgi:hypothetical protein